MTFDLTDEPPKAQPSPLAQAIAQAIFNFIETESPRALLKSDLTEVIEAVLRAKEI